jgi:glycosyltransferase involved in cell wall biosynthesis
MGSLLSGMNIALLTSSYEGFPMFIKESMAHGCIPVVTALPGNLTHLTDGVNCLLIHEIQDEDLVVKEAIDKVIELSGNKFRCMELSGNAYQYARINFNRTRFNEAYRDLFR